MCRQETVASSKHGQERGVRLKKEVLWAAHFPEKKNVAASKVTISWQFCTHLVSTGLRTKEVLGLIDLSIWQQTWKVKLQAVGWQVATKLEMRPAIQCEAHCGHPFGRQRDSVRQRQDLVAAWTQLYTSVLPSLGQTWCTASDAQSESLRLRSSHGSHPKTNYSSKTAIDKICELQPAL